jgi:hypothetical protein
MMIGCATQADLSGYDIERPVDLGVIQPIAPTGDEQVRGHGSPGPMALASGDVVCEDPASGGVQRHQSILTEFGAADR